METKPELRDIQLRLIAMLQFFHEYCEDYHLRYYLIGGSMLGAVRHNGFIPWDDDIDVGMPRSDYDRLSALFSESGKFVLETNHSTDENYFFPFSKLYDTSTTLIENKKHQLVRGLYIDIFPLDGCGNTKRESVFWTKRIGWKLLLLKLLNSPDKKERGFIKNLGIQIVRLLPAPIVNKNKLKRQIEKLCKKHSFDTSEYAGAIVGAWGVREIMKRQWFGEPKLYTFESIQVYGVQMYDEYLYKLYGDWHKYPQEVKRVPHHDYILLDLNKPYRDRNIQIE